jgi:hypothetical protein
MNHRHAMGVMALLAAGGMFASCQGKAPATETAAQAGEPATPVYESPGKPQLVPVNLKYRLLEVPQVGQPFAIELTIESSVDTASLGYSIDAGSGFVVDAQSATWSVASQAAHAPESTVVRFTPVAEGRFHINVNCNVMVNGQMMSRVVPIAIQVGQGTRQLEQIGELGQDADGNPIVSLPANTDDD